MKYIYPILFIITNIIILILSIPIWIIFQVFKITMPKRVYRNWVTGFCRLWSKTALWSGGIKYTANGVIPDKVGTLLLSNHQSYIDIYLILAVLKTQFAFVVKKTLFYSFPLNLWLYELGCEPFSRKANRKEVARRKKIIERLKKGDNFIIFPEGTRTHTGIKGEYRKASLNIGKLADANIVFLEIDGSYKLFPRDTIFIRPGTVKIKFQKNEE